MGYRRSLVALVSALALALPLVVAAAPPDPATATDAAASNYIVRLEAAPVALYTGGVAGLEATNPRARGEVRLDSQSPTSQAYARHLETQQEAFVASLAALLGRAVEPIHTYQWAMNGVALSLTPSEADLLRDTPGVAEVHEEQTYHLTTDAGPAWIGAEEVWSGAATGSHPGTKGEGVVVGILDTGINHDHPSFAAVDAGPDLELGTADDHAHTNPRGTYYGLCDPVTGAPFCNEKLIGVRDLIGTGPLDDHGHGSHTASTVAGNHVSATIEGPALTTITRAISGVAPHANLITYKVCDSRPVAACAGTIVAEAIDAAVMDMVDVINFSIGGGATDPWSDASAQMFLGARAAGTFVATSAGNDGPDYGTVGAPANAPWLLSVGASTHDRAALNGLVDLSGGEAPPADLMGPSFTDGYGPAPIVHAADHGDAMCLNPFPPGTFDGEIVVCDRGVNPRVEKGRNVAVGGAGGFVLANTEAEGEGTVADPHEIPAVHLGYTAGEALRTWLASGADHEGRILGTTIDQRDENGDVMAGFSSRGVNEPVPGVIKPDITAPGVNVLAAGPSTDGPDAGFVIMSGTSMSSPHAAGAAALTRAVNPTWTPAEVQSAIMTTALTEGIRKEDGETPTDPFDRGSGRVDLTRATIAGLLFDVSEAEYLAADPTEGGDPTELNIPSLGDAGCVDACVWTRTVRNPLDSTVSWTVEPAKLKGATLSAEPRRFTLAPGETRSISFRFEIDSLPPGTWVFSEFVLSNDHELAPDVSLPVAVRPGGETIPVDIVADGPQGTVTDVDIVAPMDVKDLRVDVQGLTQGTVKSFTLVQDPTPLDPYDTPGLQTGAAGVGTYTELVTLESDAPLFGAAITDTTAIDLDLFVGIDTNGDGVAQADEEICSSASATALEACTLTDLEAGTYWVVVQNWLTGAAADSVDLTVAAVEGVDVGNLEVEASRDETVKRKGGLYVQEGETISFSLSWDEPEMAEGTTWFALVDLGSSSQDRGDMGRMLVKISR